MTAKEVERIILRDNWYLVGQEGSHCQYKHNVKKGKVTIPFHNKPKDLNRKILNSIFKQAQLNLRDYV